MKDLTDIRHSQCSYLCGIRQLTREWVSTISHDKILGLLLSGSLARGDYMPGSFGAMVDITAFVRSHGDFDPNLVFGPDMEPDIPYHCIKPGHQGFQIAIHSLEELSRFWELGEPKQAAILESEILLDPQGILLQTLGTLQGELPRWSKKKLQEGLGYISYLISDYKKERWINRQAWTQLHGNLDLAIQTAIRCIYYKNVRPAPAEDRRLYYSYTLPQVPADWVKLSEAVLTQSPGSFQDYQRREDILTKHILPFFQNSSIDLS